MRHTAHRSHPTNRKEYYSIYLHPISLCLQTMRKFVEGNTHKYAKYKKDSLSAVSNAKKDRKYQKGKRAYS